MDKVLESMHRLFETERIRRVHVIRQDGKHGGDAVVSSNAFQKSAHLFGHGNAAERAVLNSKGVALHV